MLAFSRLLLGVCAAIIALLAVIGALALLALGSAAVIRFIIPDSQVVAGTEFSGTVAWAKSLQRQAGEDEARAARETSLVIRRWAVDCGLAKIEADGVARSTDPADPVFSHLSQTANTLFDGRVVLANEVGSTFTILEWATIAGILIGLGTTICAGLRSDDQALGGWARTVRILAVVFPALGTAVAAVAAFYGPREELLRVSQALATLQQLHAEVQVGLVREPCPGADGRARILKKFEGWEDKLIQQLPATTAVRIGARAKDSKRTID